MAVGSCVSMSRWLYGGPARKLPDCSGAHGQFALVGRRASGSGQLSAHACGMLRQSMVEYGGGWRLAYHVSGSAYIVVRAPLGKLRVSCVLTQRDAWG